MSKFKGSFLAFDEQGRESKLNVFVELISAATMRDPRRVVEGQKFLLTEDGKFVNRLDKGRYQIACTGELLQSDDESAP